LNFRRCSTRDSGLSIEEVWHGGGRVRQAYQGAVHPARGTISGPTMMALADFAMYVGGAASIGRCRCGDDQPQHQLPRKPAARDLIAECRLLKLGKRLAVGEVTSAQTA
jgi:acyl-coenzyme A thioesterase PaaI-like protein